MRAVYLMKESFNNIIRKIMIDMAYLVSHKQVRLLKFYFEDGLYLPFKNDNGNIEKYFLTKDKIVKEDTHHFYFDFKFKPEQVEQV